jgi:hypothetical protein
MLPEEILMKIFNLLSFQPILFIEFSQCIGENTHGYVVYDRINKMTKEYVGFCELNNELSATVKGKELLTGCRNIVSLIKAKYTPWK